MGEFKDKIVLVTGAGSGIGRETALKFAKKGANVVVSDINDKGGEESVEMIHKEGGTGTYLHADVAEYGQVVDLIQNISRRFGKIDVAVNNAGIGGNHLLKTAEYDHNDWHKVIAINQTGVFYCMQEEIKEMLKRKQGCIVNIASIAGIRGLPNSLAYVASKHAVVGMTKTAAMEYARHNIRVNAVCPVFTITNLFKPEYYPNPEIPKKLKASIPMKRFSQASEMADAIMYLSSDNASFITGHALPVDGGLTA